MLPSLPMILSPQREYKDEVSGDATAKQEYSVGTDKHTEWRTLTPSRVRVAGMLPTSSLRSTSSSTKTSTAEKEYQVPDLPEPLRLSDGTNVNETDALRTVNQQDSKTNQGAGNIASTCRPNTTKVEEPLHTFLKGNTIVSSSPKSGKKKPKQIRHLERTLNCLLSDNEEVKDEKSFAFAQAYFLKVTERLEDTDNATLNEFLKTMNDFGSTIVDATDLYKKITKVLKKYPDLCEEFIAFLLPEQAMECGKFMEYLMLTNMRNFCRMLELYYSKQPSQLRKIYSSLSALASKHDVTTEDVKNLFLPQLRNNSLLANAFLQLLPTEYPRESSLIDYDNLDFSNIDIHSPKLEDWFETIQVPTVPEDNLYGGENCTCPCHITPDDKTSRRAAHCISCKTKFVNGRIYIQTGKVLRPAKVSFTELDAMERLSVKDPKSRRKRERSESSAPSNKKSNCNKSETVPPNVAPGKPQPSKTSSKGAKHKAEKFPQKKGAKASPAAKSKVSSPSVGKKVGKAAAQDQKSTAGRASRTSVPATQAKATSTKKNAPQAAKKAADKADTSSSRPSRPATRSGDRAAAAAAVTAATGTVTRRQAGNKAKDEHLQPVVVISKKLAEEALSVYMSSTSPPIRNSVICDSSTGAKRGKENVLKATSESEGENVVTSTVTVEELEHLSDHAANESVLSMDTSAPSENVLEPKELWHRCEQGIVSAYEAVVQSSTDDVGGNNETSSLDDDQSTSSPGSADVEDIEDIDIGPASSPNDSDEIVLSDDNSSNEERIVNRPPSMSWTRDEDKIILQTFQTETVSEIVFEKLQGQLPARSADEIRNRFKTLMSYLQRMAAGMQESSQ